MIPAASSVVFFVASMWWVTSSCQGRLVFDVGKTEDDEWPVLCPPETFYDKKTEKCTACSRCPTNTIITSPCQGLRDTKCGPFLDYRDFWPAHAGTQTGKESSQEKNSNDQGSNEDFDTKPTEWKSVTLTLIVVICTSVFIAVCISVGILCARRRRLQTNDKLACEYSPPPEQV